MEFANKNWQKVKLGTGARPAPLFGALSVDRGADASASEKGATLDQDFSGEPNKCSEILYSSVSFSWIVSRRLQVSCVTFTSTDQRPHFPIFCFRKRLKSHWRDRNRYQHLSQCSLCDQVVWQEGLASTKPTPDPQGGEPGSLPPTHSPGAWLPTVWTQLAFSPT